MNREQIIERVARTLNRFGDRYKEYPNCSIDLEKLKANDTLDIAGFFDLLEAANKASKDFTNWLAAHEPDREIYRFQYLEKTMRELEAAIAKITGVDESDN